MRAFRASLLVALAAAALPIPGFAGQLLIYPALGLLPGLVVSDRLAARESALVRMALGIVIAPIVATVVAWVVVTAGGTLGTAAILVTMIGVVGTLERLIRDRNPAADPARTLPGAVLAWAAGLALVVIAVPLINPYLLVRSDGWIHAQIVTEISTRGIPPEDPRMAGVRLNYVWFFNFFVSLLTALRGQEPLRFMTLFDAANAFATVVFVAAAAARAWDRRAAHAAAALMVLGLNAGAFLLWPLRLVKSFTGEVRGLAEVVRQIANIGWGSGLIIFDLSAPFALMVSFLDKFLIGTAINIAYLEMIAWVWAWMVWIRDGERASLAVLALATMGMMLFHSVVGLSVIPSAFGALALLGLARARWSGLPARSRTFAAAAATGIGTLITLPYVRSITSGWAPSASGIHHRFLSPDPPMAWTILTACFVPLLFAVPAVRSGLRDRNPAVAALAALLVALVGFSLVVNLPEHNSSKFVFECFVPAVLLAAPGFGRRFTTWWRTRRALAVFVASLFVIPGALTVHGYLLDHTWTSVGPRGERPGEPALYRWMRSETPRGAVFVDRGFRDDIAVKGARRLYLGTPDEPEKAAFPLDEMRRRRSVMQDLYGDFAAPESTAAGLHLPGRPVYVLFRPGNPSAVPAPWDRLRAAAPDAELVYDRDGYRVVRLAPGAGS